ncbi:MAG: peptidoglycan DD-metalloendopeptidase family protein [Eubacteriales bacterium]|nr:peptidoglycan DD-metalloendopeptidase family protein [Eubacteriales bacterium]
MLAVDGEKIGYLDNITTISDVVSDLTADIYASTGIVYRFDGVLSYEINRTPGHVKYISDEDLYKKLLDRSSTSFVKAYALYVDGRFVAACENKNDIPAVIERLEREETERVGSASIESVDLCGDIIVTECISLAYDIKTREQLYGILKSMIVTIDMVNILGKISGKIESELSERSEHRNPDEVSVKTMSDQKTAPENITVYAKDIIATEAIMKGQERTEIIHGCPASEELINHSVDYGIPRVYMAAGQQEEADAAGDMGMDMGISLSYKYVLYESVKEPAKHKTIYRYNKFLFNDTQITIEEGADGLNLTTYRLEYIANKLISRQILSHQNLELPVDRVIIAGTRRYPEAGVTESDYVWPLTLIEEPVITSDYEECRPEYDGDLFHFGIDIQVDRGTEIYASNGGTVSYVYQTNSYGIMVIIDHDGGIQTCYAHLSEALVEIGDHINQGQVIALSGNTGVSTAPHLHFEVRAETLPQDPFDYLHEKPWSERY